MRSEEEGLSGPSLVRDRRPLTFDYVPDRLFHRDTELNALRTAFRVVSDGAGGQSMVITGSVGAGKTALSKVFTRDFTEACRKKGLVVQVAYVNCRKNASEGLTLLSILQTFDKGYPERGYSTQEMLKDLRKLIQARGVHLVVVLDEADALLRKGASDLLYTLTRFDDEKPTSKPSLSVLLVTSRSDLLATLDAATRSTLKLTNRIDLGSYAADQLQAIVRHRVELAFHKGTVPDDVIDLIAEVAAEEGNARTAIELLERAANEADATGAERVDAEHVRASKAHIHPFLTEAKLRNLGPHQLFVLEGVARRLQKSRRPYLTTGEAEEAYRIAAEEHGETGRAHTQFWKYLKELETAGILRLKKTEATANGLTQLISLPDAPASILLEKLKKLPGRGRDE